MKTVFNLRKHLVATFAAKKQKSVDKQIETKLNEENKDQKEQQETTEKQLKKDRKGTGEFLIEKNLEKNRTSASSGVLIEKSLNDSKSKLMSHRNESAAKGNINKVEEKRIAMKEKNESNKQVASSETEKSRQFYNTKSPDGLKLAQQIKKAQEMDFDIDQEDWPEDSFENLEIKKNQDPEKFWQQEGSSIADSTIETLPRDIIEKIKTFKEDVGDLESDPDFLHSVFSERTVMQKDIGGTSVKQMEVDFDLRDSEGDLYGVFDDGEGGLDDKKFLSVLLKYIKMNNPDVEITEDSIDLQEEMANWTGKATYFVPINQ